MLRTHSPGLFRWYTLLYSIKNQVGCHVGCQVHKSFVLHVVRFFGVLGFLLVCNMRTIHMCHGSRKEALACYNFHDRTHSRACHVVARWAVTTRAHASTSNRRKMRYLADESSQITSHIRWRYTCTRIKADTACIIQSCLPPSPPARQLKRRTAGSPGEAALNEIETRSRRTPVISLAAAVWPWGVSVQAHSNRPCSW